MGKKWHTHRCDHLSWTYTNSLEDHTGHGRLLVEIHSLKMFRKEFVRSMTLASVANARSVNGYTLDFIRPIHGLSLTAYDCFLVIAKRKTRDYSLIIQCSSCKEINGSKVTWNFAEDPSIQPESITVTD